MPNDISDNDALLRQWSEIRKNEAAEEERNRRINEFNDLQIKQQAKISQEKAKLEVKERNERLANKVRIKKELNQSKLDRAEYTKYAANQKTTLQDSSLSSMSGFSNLLKSNLIYDRQDLSWYEKFNRFGAIDPYNNLSQSKEYIFFTKPDCHIFTPNTTTLQPALSNDPFFIDMAQRYPHVIQMLQSSAGSTVKDGMEDNITKNPFMVLLSNSVKNTIDFNSLTAGEMDGPVNMYGSHINYRKDAWTGDENVDFSLEFEDSRFLEVYLLLRTYEEYERYKSVGLIYPPNLTGASEVGAAKHNFNGYIQNKELHDTFGIYRFIVGEDYQTIIYYSYICGAYFNSVPRDAFNDLKNGEGLTFSVDFKAFSIMDMNPIILANFNKLIMGAYGNNAMNGTELPIYGTKVPNPDGSNDNNLAAETNARINGSWAKYPMVAKITRNSSIIDSSRAWFTSKSMAHQYRLQWFSFVKSE